MGLIMTITIMAQITMGISGVVVMEAIGAGIIMNLATGDSRAEELGEDFMGDAGVDLEAADTGEAAVMADDIQTTESL
jgi:hypothetical protein